MVPSLVVGILGAIHAQWILMLLKELTCSISWGKLL